MKSKLLYFALAFASGSLSFWTPIVLARIVFGDYLGFLLAFFLLTLLLPLFVCFVLEALTERWRRERPLFASAMLLGIWATAAFWSTLASTFSSDEGFHAAGAWNYIGSMTALFPLTTVMITTYDGSLFAVLFTTVALAVFSGTHWSFQPLLSRCIIFGQR